MKKTNRYFLVLLSSVLLTLPWYQQFSGIIILIAFIPLLFVEDYLFLTRQKNKSVVLYGYAALTFGVWNLLTTYWIYHAALVGVIAAILVNTFLMSTVFWMFHLTKRKLGARFGHFALIVYWLGFEYFYLNAEISWPWLNLGNALAKDIKLIQWYEYTGTLGGTLWIILVNLAIFRLIQCSLKSKFNQSLLVRGISLSILIITPIIISLTIFKNYNEKGKEYNIAVIQPNIDPYHEKFNGLSSFQQLNIILTLADSITDSTTDYVVAPETALDNNLWINSLENNYSIQAIREFVYRWPKVNFVIGIDAYKRYMPGEELSPTARYAEQAEFYYDAFNSAIQIDTTGAIPVYHKSKLVVGVEKMPYPKFFKMLEKVILDLGGTTGSRGTQDYRGTFRHTTDDTRIAPVICYESVYGEYVTDYIKNGANLIFVITNDGWWGDTPGYKQHLNYSQIRAIETRRSIARSANTGISAFINQKGEIMEKTGWWVPAAIKNSIKANKDLTFYVRYGDYIGRIAGFFALLGILYTIVQLLITKKH
ncbi:MAG: apolipoprotein N-acyltransferase [Bacteroidales bacterium]|jgi:apolipoprotein N-acyltransferase|nr:apolipoprotein N-acyltransferase [Bacteroidales bacterium]